MAPMENSCGGEDGNEFRFILGSKKPRHAKEGRREEEGIEPLFSLVEF